MLNDDSIMGMFEELLGTPSAEKEPKKKIIPYQVFNFPEDVGSETWVLDSINKKMIRAFNNSEVVQISKPDENNKVLVRYSGTFVRVPAEYVCDIGFN